MQRNNDIRLQFSRKTRLKTRVDSFFIVLKEFVFVSLCSEPTLHHKKYAFDLFNHSNTDGNACPIDGCQVFERINDI